MKLTDFTDMDAFITAFNNHVRVMRNHDMGLVARDEDVLYAFIHVRIIFLGIFFSCNFLN